MGGWLVPFTFIATEIFSGGITIKEKSRQECRFKEKHGFIDLYGDRLTAERGYRSTYPQETSHLLL